MLAGGPTTHRAPTQQRRRCGATTAATAPMPRLPPLAPRLSGPAAAAAGARGAASASAAAAAAAVPTPIRPRAGPQRRPCPHGFGGAPAAWPPSSVACRASGGAPQQPGGGEAASRGEAAGGADEAATSPSADQQQQHQQQPEPPAPAPQGAATAAAAGPQQPQAQQQQPPPPARGARGGGATIKAAGAKAGQLLHRLQERPLPQVSPSLAAFLGAGLLLGGALYIWARGTSARRNNPYSFTMNFTIASKVFPGTQLRMKGVQIGRVTEVSVEPANVAVRAEVYDARNVVPRGSRFDINMLGLVTEGFLDITTPDGCSVEGAAGPHSAACHREGRIICHNSVVDGSQGSSMDFLMKVYLKHLSGEERMRRNEVEGERYTPAPQMDAAPGTRGRGGSGGGLAS